MKRVLIAIAACSFLWGAVPVLAADEGPSPYRQTDADFWNRAGNNLYVSVSAQPQYWEPGAPLVATIQPGQPLYLLTYSSSFDVSQAQWFANSPDVTFSSPNDNITWTIDGHGAAVALFQAQKPGIYTVQSLANGVYSVPLVILVGIDQVAKSENNAVQISPEQQGVVPLSEDPGPARQERTDSGIQYGIYSPQNGWLPVVGHIVDPSVHSVSVVLTTPDYSRDWSYPLPIQPDGSFRYKVRIPFSGMVSVNLVPNLMQQFNARSGWSTSAGYHVQSDAPELSQRELGLLESDFTDLASVSSGLVATASGLMEHAPSKDSGIVAISNYVAEHMRYDMNMLQSPNSIWMPANKAWETMDGVCQNYAELTATMLKAIGVPAILMSGGGHEWLQAWDGQRWMILDPTWSTNADAPTIIRNDYITNTARYQNTHHIFKEGTPK